MSLTEKVVVVTGGAGLLGKEFIEAVVKNHGIGVIADLSGIRGVELEREMKEKYGNDAILFSSLDISSEKNINELIVLLHKRFGRIDALVNNAYPRNKNFGTDFFNVKYDDFCQNINLNLGGYFLTSQLFSKYFLKQGRGNIINISSIYGVIAPRFEIYEGTKLTTPIEYAIIKSAIIHFTKYLAKYLKGTGIRVNCLSPGGIFDRQPEQFIQNYNRFCNKKGMLDSKDISGTMVYLLSEMSCYLTGQNIVVDDGFTL